MLLTERDIKYIAFITLIMFLYILTKVIKRKRYNIEKVIPWGKAGEIIKHLQEDGFTYLKTIIDLSYDLIADDKEYTALVAKKTIIMKKGFKKYAIRIRSTKTTGKSINSKLVRYPFVELANLGFPNIILYDYEKSRYRTIIMPNNKKFYRTLIITLLIFIATFLFFLIRR